MTPDGWRKIDRGLFESADGQWRIANPWKLATELRHRWLVAERRASGSGWSMHDGDHATLQAACSYVNTRCPSNPPSPPAATEPHRDPAEPRSGPAGT